MKRVLLFTLILILTTIQIACSQYVDTIPFSSELPATEEALFVMEEGVSIISEEFVLTTLPYFDNHGYPFQKLTISYTFQDSTILYQPYAKQVKALLPFLATINEFDLYYSQFQYQTEPNTGIFTSQFGVADTNEVLGGDGYCSRIECWIENPVYDAIEPYDDLFYYYYFNAPIGEEVFFVPSTSYSKLIYEGEVHSDELGIYANTQTESKRFMWISFGQELEYEANYDPKVYTNSYKFNKVISDISPNNYFYLLAMRRHLLDFIQDSSSMLDFHSINVYQQTEEAVYPFFYEASLYLQPHSTKTLTVSTIVRASYDLSKEDAPGYYTIILDPIRYYNEGSNQIPMSFYWPDSLDFVVPDWVDEETHSVDYAKLDSSNPELIIRFRTP